MGALNNSLNKLAIVERNINNRELHLSSSYITCIDIEVVRMQFKVFDQFFGYKFQSSPNFMFQYLKDRHLDVNYEIESNQTSNEGNEIGKQILLTSNLLSLTSIDLSSNKIGSKGIKLLMKESFPLLIKLDLTCNQIGTEGVRYLGNGELKSLEELLVSGNFIKGEGLIFLVEGYFSHLSSLQLAYNKIYSDSTKFLTLFLNKEQKLRAEIVSDLTQLQEKQIYINLWKNMLFQHLKGIEALRKQKDYNLLKIHF